MTTMEPMTEAEEQRFYEAHNVDLIHIVHRHRQEAKNAKAVGELAEQALRAFLAELDGHELVDHERGLRAYLRDSAGSEWDLRNASAGVLIALQEMGLLTVNNTAFNAIRKAAPSSVLDEAARYRRETIKSTSLIVEKLK